MEELAHVAGILDALTGLFITGLMITFFWGKFPRELSHDWSPHDECGLMPGVIEQPTSDVPPGVGGCYPELVGFFAMVGGFATAYLLGSVGLVTVVFVTELLLGWSLTSFPPLYFVGAFALLYGGARMQHVTAEIRASKTNLGFRGL